ncbi:MAG: sigma-70 family RNA polymerase sigma factor [Planctomycetes bacterium]|nr:sigma-70 family RNA polymerase sigma factor [Planctomycetota bacterium]
MSEPLLKMNREDERLLIARVRAGDRMAVRELVDRHKERLFAFIWRMVRNHHDAEEICQDAFLKAFASLDSFSADYRFSTWLFTIGYRVCLNRLRRRHPVSGEVDLSALAAGGAPEAGAVESQEAGEVRQLVWSAVDSLSAPQRAAILLFYRYELSCQEIARVLELPVATVKSHLHRGRNSLRETMEALGEQKLSELRNLSRHAG